MMMASNEDEDCCIISCRLSSAPSFVCLSLRILSLPHTFRGNQRETCYVRTVTKLHLVYFTRQKTSPALTFMSSRSIVSFILRPNVVFFFDNMLYLICPVFGRLAAAGERRHDMPGISVPSGTLLHFCKVANSAPAGKSQVLTPGPPAAPDLMYSFEGRGVGEYLGSSSGNSTI